MVKIDRYKPAVPREILLFLAGIVWEGVGVMLCFLAFSWLSARPALHVWAFAVAGAALAMLIHHFGFLRIVDKNLGRILEMDEKSCLFSFISWKSYLLIMVMVAMGVGLRHSALPKQYLAILYIAIGLALILSSVRYMRFFYRNVRKPR